MRNSPSRVLLVSLLTLLLVGSVVAPVAGSADAASTSFTSSDQSLRGQSIDTRAVTESHEAIGTAAAQIEAEFDPNTATLIRIEPTPDRDAQWEVSVRYALADETEIGAFETTGERFLDGEVGPDPALFEGFAREASRSVDRAMRIENVDREVIVHEDPSEFDIAEEDTVAVGELRLTFTWTAFLGTDGENLVLGDALTTPEGTWLRSLAEGQTLQVATPEGYAVTGTPGSTVQIRDNAVTIEGPRTFAADERVVVVYAPAGAVGPPWQMLTAAIVIAALLIAGSVVGYQRRGSDENGVATSNGSDEGGVRQQNPDADVASSASATPDAESETADGSKPVSEDEGEEEDRSLLSDEERVERLLADNGGRMRQADIVTETGWSDAKVSQLLSAMADEERVEKLRLGRENLISLPDDADDHANDANDADADADVGGSDGDDNRDRQ
jgi:uncharacterized membrane protein